MSSRTTCRIAVTLIVPLVSARDARGQMCNGTTTFVVRDTAGRVMNAEQMKELRITHLDGVPTRFREGEGERSYYAYEVLKGYMSRDSIVTVGSVAMENPLMFRRRPPYCGEVGDVTFAYGGKVMRMLFDIGTHNTYYQIDSPRFQEGTFHLRSLACEGGARPPLIDNATTGKCLVSAASWDSMDEEWVRTLVIERPLGIGFVHLSADACRSRGLVAITTPAELGAVWRSHPEAFASSPEPAVDFRWQFVLAVYQTGRDGSYRLDGVRVDKSGDLTFVPVGDPLIDSGFCSVLLLEHYRSGVVSVAGKPLPPPLR